MSFTLPPLPWAIDALAGKGLSKEQITFHYEKHHQGYVTKLNVAATSMSELASQTVEQLIQSEKGPIFNLAAQIWNHTFYWHSMSPNGGGQPKGQLADDINKSFGSFDKFKDEFTAASVGHFGSGWAWLVRENGTGELRVIQTHDAGTPLTDPSVKPLLACDVWEHAYYIDYRNDRASYVKAFWNLVNWDFAASNLASS